MVTVAKEPTFALGDSSGISPGTLYTIIMVDSTCPNARKLHYARANFKNNFDITNIETDSPAVLDYVAPGSVGEKGDDRQYSFLMYTNPGRKEITDLQLPGDDEAFDITKFQDDNGQGVYCYWWVRYGCERYTHGRCERAWRRGLGFFSCDPYPYLSSIG
ncbi:uncharacterized protein J4E87_002020 [Alternaria ethzedia]|uniref:uncharacterized protein n=1 Tax=Alternaria ethzedia TaxID=181014 RepID=UPI0020C2E143|nr:uncharacterized protein J4E87_002020 [Alternaria ethzedia]KAI4632546.1 hypothetical protein J4E87_002020 [Alternaria ethzedia]